MAERTVFDITNEPTKQGGAFVARDHGTEAGRMTYVRSNDTLWIVDHTEVDDAFRGQGVGFQLLTAVTEHVRKAGVKVIPLCPYAKAAYAKHPELADVVAK